MHAVIIEWQDGTVSVNGPYRDNDVAVKAARKIGLDIRAEERLSDPRAYVETDDGCVLHDADDQIDVYAREMGSPVTID